MELIKALIALAVITVATWWIISPSSQSTGRARAMVVALVAILISCVGG